MGLTGRLGPWRVPLAWALVILVATSLPLPSAGWAGTSLPLDRAAHFLLYLGLGWGSGRALRRTGQGGVLPTVAVLAAGMLFAAADEAHQGWLVGRTPSVADWVADVVGLGAGLALGALTTRRSGEEREARERER